MKSSTIQIIVGVLILAGVIGLVSLFKNKQVDPWAETTQSVSDNPTTNVKTDTHVQATTVKVSQFYNGQNGYSLSIPSGNNSTCIWNWSGGSAVVPYSQTTYANTATEKHVLSFGTYPNGDAVEISTAGYNFKVTCIDDFGNQYIGEFPTNK